MSSPVPASSFRSISPRLSRTTLLPHVALVLFGLGAWGVGHPPATASAEGPPIEGSLRYDFYAYPDSNRRGDNVENFFALDLRTRGALTTTSGYRIAMRAVADDSHYTAAVLDPLMENSRRPYVTFPEAVIDWNPRAGMRVSVGRQIINWSGIDEIQPGNLMTPLDETDLLRREQVGAYAITTHLEFRAASLDLAIVPAVFQGARIPQGRWRFAPDGIEMHRDEPEADADETQAGLRMSTRFHSLEFALLGYVGRDMFPIFTLETPANPNDAQAVRSRNPRTAAGGFTASLPLGESWLLRSEVLFYASPDSDRDDFFQYVPLGAEYTNGDWRVVLNYLRYDRTSRGNGTISQGERSFYSSFLFGEVSWDAGGRLRMRLRSGYDFEERFALIEPEISYRIWGDLRVGINAAVVLANDAAGGGYFDLIRHEDRVGLRFQYFL